jgi:bifunctional DNA-binding transcriptional regulator/antitoxin component of YhaV-PrlF toxin-antitoxin module
MRTTVTVRGQTAVPSKIRKMFRMDAKSKIEWIVEGNTIKIVPIPKDPVKTFEGALKGKLDFKDFIKDRQKERKEEARKR